MRRRILFVAVVLSLSLGLFFFGCENGGEENLLEILLENPDLASLVTVIRYVDAYATLQPALQQELRDETELLTIFAPENSAFDFIDDAGNDDDILSEEDIRAYFAPDTDTDIADTLYGLLGYHVIDGAEVTAEMLRAASGTLIGPTEANENLWVTVSGGDISLKPEDATSGAGIIQTDLDATNGILHKISAVMGL